MSARRYSGDTRDIAKSKLNILSKVSDARRSLNWIKHSKIFNANQIEQYLTNQKMLFGTKIVKFIAKKVAEIDLSIIFIQ